MRTLSMRGAICLLFCILYIGHDAATYPFSMSLHKNVYDIRIEIYSNTYKVIVEFE